MYNLQREITRQYIEVFYSVIMRSGSFLVSVQSFGHAPDRSHFTI